MQNHINGEAFVHLKDAHMKELGIKAVGHRLTIANFINDWRPGPSKAPASRPAKPAALASRGDAELSDDERGKAAPQAPVKRPAYATAAPPKPRPPAHDDLDLDANPFQSRPKVGLEEGEKPPAQKRQQPDIEADSPPPAPKRQQPPARQARAAPPPPAHESDSPPPPKRQQPKRAPDSESENDSEPPSREEEDEEDGDDGDDGLNLVPCKFCGRKFAQDRISKHQQICAKAKKSRRKTFDAKKHRLNGTEAAAFAKNGEPAKQPKKVDYKAAHERLIATLRNARLAEGGAPVPEPEDDRVTCPHCGRKFSQSAADRHIPGCERMKSAALDRGPARKPGRR
jgi:hypothetical protein